MIHFAHCAAATSLPREALKAEVIPAMGLAEALLDLAHKLT